jgi:hypothetical protein
MTAEPALRGRAERAAGVVARLPAGTAEAGLDSLRRGLACVGRPGAVPATGAAVIEHLVRPVMLIDRWPDPTDPLPVAGGAVNADLTGEDRETLARLRHALLRSPGPAALDAESFAAEAQLWRLAVTPYRRLHRTLDRRPTAARSVAGRLGGPRPRAGGVPASDRERRPVAGRLVVDLSALWAGPLATSLLADLGATVVKVDPRCRPDGFGAHPDLYRHLNGGKEIVDLDLRLAADRHRFEELVSGADLVVDSFSRRVMPNLGYGPAQLRALRPELATLSIVAFPAGSAEQDWIAYGPGVHATSGLAELDHDGRPRFRPAPIAYPDVLAGLAAFAAGTELLAAPGRSAHREVSLAAALAPLVERALAERPLAERPLGAAAGDGG